jgi:hypothetical protein
LTNEHISFSAWRDWHFCPFKYKITRVDKVSSFQGNEYSTFGTAVHDTAEQILIKENMQSMGIKDTGDFDPLVFFKKSFKKEIESLPPEQKEKIQPETILKMKKQGEEIIPLILPELKKYFGSYTLFKTEYELRQRVIKHEDWDFYGFIDLILKTDDGKYHIIDWKTCSWGWDTKKRTSKEYTYQLTYYKYFLSQQLGIDRDKIETYFALLKRTAKKDKIEIFKVSSGEKKISNALTILDNCVINVKKKNFVKNKINCSQCEYNKTIYCN